MSTTICLYLSFNLNEQFNDVYGIAIHYSLSKMNHFGFFLKISGFPACSRGGLSETNLLSSDDDVDGSKKNAEAICNEHYKHERSSLCTAAPREGRLYTG